MSRFLNPALKDLAPYTPGEQPSGRKYLKLNTNESPCPPSPKAIKYAEEELKVSNLYPPLDGGALREKIAESYGVTPSEVIVTNGSDEVLNFIFKAFCSKTRPAAFADITYGFYSVFAEINGVPYVEIPLKDDFSLDPADYIGISKNIFIANPNAPTGRAIGRDEIEKIAASNPDNVVAIDEAYVDFGGETALPLIKKYRNLIVVRTFSKSRALAGARVGYAFADPELISDLYRIIYSTNPYNISRADLAMALGAIEDSAYTERLCKDIIAARDHTQKALGELGFTVIESSANFIFARPGKIEARELYLKLKDAGILIRYFDKPRIKDWLRITVGSLEQMQQLILAIKNILLTEEAR